MGLTRKPKPLFTQAWVDGLRAVPEAGMTARFKISSTTYGAWDPATDDKEVLVHKVYYEGPARVQPLRTATRRTTEGNDTSVQPVLVSIPISTPEFPDIMDTDFRVGLDGEVTSSPLNPALMLVKFRLSEFLDSSNPFERTIMFNVNQESRDH